MTALPTRDYAPELGEILYTQIERSQMSVEEGSWGLQSSSKPCASPNAGFTFGPNVSPRSFGNKIQRCYYWMLRLRWDIEVNSCLLVAWTSSGFRPCALCPTTRMSTHSSNLELKTLS